MRGLLLLAVLLVVPGRLTAQQLDPDWCLTCADSREHFVAGVGIQLATRLVLPKAHPWQRLAVTGAIALAFEVGQADATRSRGPGYGISPKDWLVGMAGALVVEWVATR